MKTKIKTFESACKALGIKTLLPEVSAMPEKHQKALIAHYKLIIITEALNDGWQPDWNNWGEYKYYPWFDLEKDDKSPSGFGFSGTGYGFAGTLTGVGSRLCFKTRALAEYAGKKFKTLYQDYFLM